jgi:hypothetical protein
LCSAALGAKDPDQLQIVQELNKVLKREEQVRHDFRQAWKQLSPPVKLEVNKLPKIYRIELFWSSQSGNIVSRWGGRRGFRRRCRRALRDIQEQEIRGGRRTRAHKLTFELLLQQIALFPGMLSAVVFAKTFTIGCEWLSCAFHRSGSAEEISFHWRGSFWKSRMSNWKVISPSLSDARIWICPTAAVYSALCWTGQKIMVATARTNLSFYLDGVSLRALR